MPWLSAVSYTHLDVYKRQMGLQTVKLSYNGAFPKDEANIMDIIFDTKGSSVKKIFMAVDQGAFSADTEATKYPMKRMLCILRFSIADKYWGWGLEG